jgi:hypothetical protein
VIASALLGIHLYDAGYHTPSPNLASINSSGIRKATFGAETALAQKQSGYLKVLTQFTS